ncbi:MAG: hypothetical protein HEQ39_16505 [Rhizobacter sp.]
MTSLQNSPKKYARATAGRVQTPRGVMLIEVMVAILILTIGVFGLMAAFARTTNTLTDVDNRALATRYADQIFNQMSAQVDRSSAGNLAASLAAFNHNATPAPNADGVPTPCATGFTNSPSTHPVITTWLTQLTATGATGLPGATAAMQQIVIEPALSNRVTISVCWMSSADTVVRQHVQRGYIN